MAVGMTDPDRTAPLLEEVAHVTLHLGGLLLQNGADTAEVQESAARFAAAFDAEAHLLVSYEALLLTAVAGGQFRTKVGYRVPAMNVNLTAVAAVNCLLERVEHGRRKLAQARAELEAVERRPPAYGRWVIIVALGLTAASLARLFGGDWPACGVAWLAGSAGTWLRQALAKRAFNLFFIPFAAALVSGVIGGAAAPAVVAEMLALAASCLLMVAAIAVGIAAPLSLIKKGTTPG
jgi:uncharacterized membrane protein YjjP (DUF1212 family)